MEAMLGTILWRPGVGDPTVVGWVTTVGYGVAAALCARAGRHASANDECPMTNDEGGNEERSAERGWRIEDGGSKVRDGETVEHRTTNIVHPTSNAVAAERKGKLNNEGTRERSGEGMVKHELPRGSRIEGRGLKVDGRRTLNIQQRTSVAGKRESNDECSMTNDEGGNEEHRTSNEHLTTPLSPERRGSEHRTSKASERELNNEESKERSGGEGRSRIDNGGSRVDAAGDSQVFKYSHFQKKALNNKGTKERRECERGSRIEDGGLRSEGAGDFQVFKFSGPQTQDARMWFGLAMGLFCLGVNKQLDLQTLLIEIGRNLAVSEGWFEWRRQVQAALAVLGIVGGELVLVAVGSRQRHFFRRNPLTIFGLALLGLYFSLRILAIDHVGESGGLDVPDEAWWLSALELAGIGFSGVASLKIRLV